MSVYARQERAVRVGIVGPHDLVERIMLSGLPGPQSADARILPSESELGLRRRLVMAPYLSEHEAPERVTRLGDSVDACLFASRIPLDYARRSGVLSVPATFIQLGGSTLGAALATARRDGLDPGRASFDGLSRADVEAGLADLGIPADGAHVRDEMASAAAIASFHERLWRLGQTSAAFTCMDQAARRLSAAGVPIVRLQPTDRAIRSALQVATLLAGHRVLTDSQIAVALVEVPALRDTARRPAPRQAREELQLTVHRFLVREAQRIQATISRISEHGFLVVGTRASLQSAGDPPFVARARATLGVVVDVGVGTGRTEHEAEAQARAALSQAAQGPVARAQAQRAQVAKTRAARAQGPSQVAGTADSEQLGLPGVLAPGPGSLSGRPTGAADLADLGRHLHDGRAANAGRPAADSLSRLRALETLSRLAQKLAADSAPVVDAELTGQLLSVTPRTARRQLRALVDEGLALPLPPARRQHPGRPRQAYRLVVEKLERRVAQ
jgi:hypothetical protein